LVWDLLPTRWAPSTDVVFVDVEVAQSQSTLTPSTIGVPVTVVHALTFVVLPAHVALALALFNDVIPNASAGTHALMFLIRPLFVTLANADLQIFIPDFVGLALTNPNKVVPNLI